MILKHNLFINGTVYVKGQEISKADEADLKRSGTKVNAVSAPKKVKEPKTD